LELNELLTWEALGSYVGLMAATFIFVQVVKAVVKTATTQTIRITALVTAVVLSVGYNLYASGLSVPIQVMSVVNGLMVGLATMKVVEVAKDGLDYETISAKDMAACEGSCPTCGKPLDA